MKVHAPFALRRALLAVSLFCVLVLLVEQVPAGRKGIFLRDVGFSDDPSEDERRHFLRQSRAFLIARAKEPFVHFLRDENVFKGVDPSLGVLVEILRTAEDYDEERWRRLYSAGVVSRKRTRVEPVCGAGAEDVPDLADPNDVRWRKENPTVYEPLIEVHLNLTNCISPQNITDALRDSTQDTALLAGRGYYSTDSDPYDVGAPRFYSYRVGFADGIRKGLQPVLKLIPEGETWRIDFPPELFYGKTGIIFSTWPTPPDCHVRMDVRVEKVLRGQTSLARCRQLTTEAFGYNPYERDRVARENGESPPRGQQAVKYGIRENAAAQVATSATTQPARSSVSEDSADL